MSTVFEPEHDATFLTREGFARLASFITSELGIRMPDSKFVMVQSRLLRRVRELGLSSIEQYGEYLFSTGGEEERDHFINAITTNKTDFFREPEHFNYLVSKALPSLDDGIPRKLNLWSAACSSGQEPYSLAMVMSEYAQERTGMDFAILGTDVSTRVLAHARDGIYSEEQIAPVPLHLKMRYFLQARDGRQKLVRVIPKLRTMVSFHRLNLMADDYMIRNRFDVIFLRNVLIYFDRQTQQTVVNRVCRHLAPGGYLFVGHSESLVEMDIPVKQISASVYRK